MSGRLYVGTRKGLFEWSLNKGMWHLEHVHFLGEPVTMLLPAGEATLLAALTLGHFGVKLHRRQQQKDWQECTVPVYPEGATVNDGPPVGDGPPRTKPASLSEIWSLETGGADHPGVLWAGTIPGGLFQTNDYGDSWQLVESLWNRPGRANWFGGGKDDPGIHSICVDPRDSQNIVIGISCAGVWHTTNGGASWSCDATGLRAEYMPPNLANDPGVQDPHRLVQCETNPDTMWIQHHNGVFLSRDRGHEWQELESPRPSAFGFAVAADPHNHDRAWFVPAVKDECRVPVDGRLVVSRTSDGGETFDVFGEGLPADQAYDIVYRHALDIDASGKTLAMGSTTGGLWVSQNAGTSWSCLSQNLPPIYCVRFAL